MADVFSNFDTRRIERRLFMLLADFSYRDPEHGLVKAKAGFYTDFASIDIFHNIFLFVIYALLAGYGDKAATIHDWLYSGYPIQKHPDTYYYPTRKEADQIMYRALRADGLARWRAWLFYIGVRIGGARRFSNEKRIWSMEA